MTLTTGSRSFEVLCPKELDSSVLSYKVRMFSLMAKLPRQLVHDLLEDEAVHVLKSTFEPSLRTESMWREPRSSG